MATKDFRASQIRTSQIIGSGSQSGKPAILVVSASDSSGFNGEALDNSTLLANVGSDVFLFVTGSKNTRTAVTLFGGDVVISGTMYAERQVVEVDLATTGSLSVSGSLHVSQSATIYEGLVVNESGEGGPENDFRVESEGEDEALFLDASENELYINKGETAFTTIIGSINDEAVRIGSAGVVFNDHGHGTNDFRVESDTEPHALFVDAGANELHINSGETAFLTTIHNVDGEAVSVTATEVVINDDGVTTVDFRVESDGEDEALFIDASANTLYVNKGNTAFATEINSTNDVAITVGAAGVVFNEDGHATNDFRVESDTKTHALFVDSGNDQVLILSGGGVKSPDESSATDLAFFVSGTIGSKDSTNKGTSVFGGDVVVSGTLYALENGISGSYLQTSLIKSDHPTEMSHLTLDAGGNIYLDSYDYGRVILREGSDEYLKFERGDTTAEDNNAIIQNMEDGKDIIFQQFDGNETLRLTDNKQVLVLSGGAAASTDEAAGLDVAFYVSGSVDSRGTAVRGTSVFGGDAVVSGTFYPNKIKSDHISGSLTHLSDGTSYLIAGANVTIVTGSSGAVTITSAGAGAADAVGWSAPAASVIATTGSLNIGTTSSTPGDSDIYFSPAGAAVFNEQGASVDFRVESNNKSNALLVNGSTDQVLILSGGSSTSTNEAVGADVAFYVSGSTSSASTSIRGTSLFGGDLVASGTILPGTDLGSNLGAPTRRFGNIYTGDLHLRNERGNWTIVEEADYLCVVNNLTGKKFKMALIPLDDD